MSDQKGSSAAITQTAATANQIRELSKIDEQIPQLLKSAGTAISALTAGPIKSSSLTATKNIAPNTLRAHKEVFLSSTREYFTLVNTISQSLFAQVRALEEAGLIQRDGQSDSDATNGGLGNLDVAWLNERARDVGRSREQELIKEIRRELEKYMASEDVENM